jgi:hypothetical protein
MSRREQETNVRVVKREHATGLNELVRAVNVGELERQLTRSGGRSVVSRERFAGIEVPA